MARSQTPKKLQAFVACNLVHPWDSSTASKNALPGMAGTPTPEVSGSPDPGEMQ